MFQLISIVSDAFSSRLRQILAVFLCLQILDVLTTLVGFRYGAGEGSYFVSQMLQFGPVAGLLMSKGIALGLALTAIALERERLVLFTNF
jgi:hypothetical protein